MSTEHSAPNILVIDDEESMRHALARGIRRAGLASVEVGTGKDGVDAFVEGGFFLPEAKSRVSWRDADSLWVGTDFGEGSMTSSGYPRVAKLWKRGTPLADAETAFEGEVDDVSVSVYRDRPAGSPRNVWSGPIEAVEPTLDRVRVRVGGPLPIVAELTHSAVEDLALASGREVWVAIKATEMRVESA